MSVALEKIDGVASVTVTLNKGEARVTLKPGNKVTLADVRKVIEKNGFTPRAAAVIAEAESVTGQEAIRVTGTNETLPIAVKTSEKVRSELKTQSGRPFIVEGVVAAPKDDPAGSIEIKDLKSTTKESRSIRSRVVATPALRIAPGAAIVR